MANEREVKDYCDMFGLTFVMAPLAPLDDHEEWPNTVCAGFDGDPTYCACIISLDTYDTCRVTKAFCGGRLLEDKVELVDITELRRATTMGTPLHPMGE